MSLYKDLRGIITQLAAWTVTGRWCDVRYEYPPLTGCRGLAFREGDKGVIYIVPDLEGLQLLRTTVHEFAHIKLHFGMLGSEADVKHYDFLREVKPGKRLPKPKENEADKLADDLFYLALHHAPSDDYLRQLMALTKYYQGGK